MRNKGVGDARGPGIQGLKLVAMQYEYAFAHNGAEGGRIESADSGCCNWSRCSSIVKALMVMIVVVLVICVAQLQWQWNAAAFRAER